MLRLLILTALLRSLRAGEVHAALFVRIDVADDDAVAAHDFGNLPVELLAATHRRRHVAVPVTLLRSLRGLLQVAELRSEFRLGQLRSTDLRKSLRNQELRDNTLRVVERPEEVTELINGFDPRFELAVHD